MPKVTLSTVHVGKMWVTVAYTEGSVLVANSIPVAERGESKSMAVGALKARGINEYNELETSVGKDLAHKVVHGSPALHLSYNGFTNFQKKVLDYVRNVPRGKVVSYGDVAVAVGHPRAYRAVGTVMATHPFPFIIPCHRVVKSDLALGRYGPNPKIKEKFLIEEGVAIVNGRIMAKHRLVQGK
jgi:O-6-methylguanine DNA methyltransferase